MRIKNRFKEFKELIEYIRSDLYRTEKSFIMAFLFMPGFRYLLHWRINRFLRGGGFSGHFRLYLGLNLYTCNTNME